MSALCKLLNIPRSTFYYERKGQLHDHEAENAVKRVFESSRGVYGYRKIKAALERECMILSRRRICRIMRKFGLVSKYTKAQYKHHITTCNEDQIANQLARQFNSQSLLSTIVSDLTYVKVKSKWHYICVLVDLFNREIISYSVGPNKTADLVYQAFAGANIPLDQIGMFHTDRGNEFKNSQIEDMLRAFNIERSLSKKGCPYDNAVAESTFKIIKVEFVNGKTFDSLDDLKTQFADYVNWFNTIRLHGTLGYQTPIEYKLNSLTYLSN